MTPIPRRAGWGDGWEGVNPIQILYIVNSILAYGR